MAMENRLLRRDPGSHKEGRVEADRVAGKRGGGRGIRLHSSYIIDSELRARTFPVKFNYAILKKAGTRTRTERLGKWCRDGVFDSKGGGLEKNRRRHTRAVYNDIQYEFINSRTLADITRMHKKQIVSTEENEIRILDM